MMIVQNTQVVVHIDRVHDNRHIMREKIYYLIHIDLQTSMNHYIQNCVIFTIETLYLHILNLYTNVHI